MLILGEYDYDGDKKKMMMMEKERWCRGHDHLGKEFLRAPTRGRLEDKRDLLALSQSAKECVCRVELRDAIPLDPWLCRARKEERRESRSDPCCTVSEVKTKADR